MLLSRARSPQIGGSWTSECGSSKTLGFWVSFSTVLLASFTREQDNYHILNYIHKREEGDSMSLFISGRKLFPRRPPQTSPQAPLVRIRSCVPPKPITDWFVCWDSPSRSILLVHTWKNQNNQGSRSKREMGRQSIMCHSLGLGLSRLHTQGKGYVTGGAVGPGGRSVGLE